MIDRPFESRYQRLAALGGILLLGFATRMVAWRQVLTENGVVLSGPDAYYHLRRAFLTLQSWPTVPQVDHFINAPVGGRVSWTPLFDGLLATLALPWRADPEVPLEVIGALLPLVLGLLQITVLYRLLRRLVGVEAALAGAAVAAILPGIVAYTRLGALDHDPLFELAVLLALDAVIAGAQGANFLFSVLQLTAALVIAVLGFAGSPLGMAVVVCALVGFCIGSFDREILRRGGRVLSLGATAAAVVVAPWVARSTWRAVEGATFEGLSLLQLSSLMAVAVLGSLLALLTRPRGSTRLWLVLGLAQIAVLATILPESVAAFLAGARYVGGGDLLLKGVAEGRGLLYLFGDFDLRPMATRLGLLPLAAALALPYWIWRGPSRPQAAMLAGWFGVTFAVALRHSRFSFSAAIALACFAGVAWQVLREKMTSRAAVLVAIFTLLPAATTYARIPGWEPYDLRGRVQLLERSGMDEVCEFLRGTADPETSWRNPSAIPNNTVLAPWSFGHWIGWIGRQPTVVGPMLTVGQSEFREAIGFFVETDREIAAALFEKYRVKYLVVTPLRVDAAWTAQIAGRDEVNFIRRDPASGAEAIFLPAAMRLVTVHLAYWGTAAKDAFGSSYPAIEGLREVFRTSSEEPGPFGEPVPQALVYEVL